MFGWGKKAREIAALRRELHASELEIEALRRWDAEQRAALRTIADMETPSANATVKRMAKVAREAL